MENPDKYDERVVTLLQELMQGSKKVTDLEEAEQRLLDHATIDFASYVKPKAALVAPKMQKLAEEDEESFSEEFDIPSNSTSAYWWL